MVSGKRYAILLCAEDSDYVKRSYGGYGGVFAGMLSEEGEIWKVFNVAAGHFPTDDELCGYEGFVITGSCSDAHGCDTWICRLVTLLKKIESLKKKVLGICFGHQILGRALGGKTGRSKAGWDIGLRNIQILPSSKLQSLNLPSQLRIIQCHRDEIRELPEKAEIMGWSEKTGVEIFRWGEHIMGIQGHPEYNTDILFHLLDRLLLRGLITESAVDEIRATVAGLEADHLAWKKLCVTFLKGRL